MGVYGPFMGAHGYPVGLPWVPSGGSVGLSWVSHRLPMGAHIWSPVRLPWIAHELPMGSHGAPTGVQ